MWKGARDTAAPSPRPRRDSGVHACRHQGCVITGCCDVVSGSLTPLCAVCAGTIKGLTTEQVAAPPLDCDIILGNTYHLGNKPGGPVLEALGGLHKFMNWWVVILRYDASPRTAAASSARDTCAGSGAGPPLTCAMWRDAQAA